MKEVRKEIEKIQKAHKDLYKIFDLEGAKNNKQCHNNIIRIKLF